MEYIRSKPRTKRWRNFALNPPNVSDTFNWSYSPDPCIECVLMLQPVVREGRFGRSAEAPAPLPVTPRTWHAYRCALTRGVSVPPTVLF